MAPLPSPPCSWSLFFYVLIFFSSSRIKNTKTILRVYLHDFDGVYRRLTTAKKAGKQLSMRFFAALASTNARRRKSKEKKKDDLSLAIGENYINKIFFFFNILFTDVFTYRLTLRNPKDIVTEKGDKKFPLLSFHLFFYLSFAGRRLSHRSLTATHSVSE